MAMFLIFVAIAAVVMFIIAWELSKLLPDFKPFKDKSNIPEPKPDCWCDNCGRGPWHRQWDPDSLTRKSRKFYCPNCLGAD